MHPDGGADGDLIVIAYLWTSFGLGVFAAVLQLFVAVASETQKERAVAFVKMLLSLLMAIWAAWLLFA